MSSLGLWSVFAIFAQTIFCVMVSWLTLDCRLAPSANELHEVTLIKLLYLYDPGACGRLHFYNYTFTAGHKVYTNIIWPVKNEVASQFRSKIRLWLAFHLMWAMLGVVNMSQESRPCGFYASLLPFTLVGIALLIIDIVYAVLFTMEAKYTSSEVSILRYINSENNYIHSITKVAPMTFHNDDEDTSWISMLIAYISLRGVVLWILNFWIVKDNYFEGLAIFRQIQNNWRKSKTPKDKLASASSNFSSLFV